MKPTLSLQPIVDNFVRSIGGEVISDGLNKSDSPTNADYLFRRHNVIAELKALETSSFGDSFRRKMSDLMTEWQRSARLIAYGTCRTDSDRMPKDCREEMFDLMAAPLQKHLVSASNRQISRTKELLGLPGARGLLWVASDGNQDLPPDLVFYLLKRILWKKHRDGTPLYSNIDGLAYFSPRMLVQVPGIPNPIILWFSGARRTDDSEMLNLLDFLQNAWPRYVAFAQGIKVEVVHGLTIPPERFRFQGASNVMPRIEIGKPRNP